MSSAWHTHDWIVTVIIRRMR